MQAYVREMCRRDPVFFIDHFAWTLDPRAEPHKRHRPFMLYEYQEEEIAAVEKAFREGTDLLTEKSRDMGVSWLYVAWVAHKWLFEPEFTALLGSRKEDYVDNRQPDSLFGKIDYMIRYLPNWMMPIGFDFNKHRSALKLLNPENNNTIQGESTNPEFSRGGRFSIIFFDEFAFWEWADRAWTSAGDATKTRLAVSTPNGANFFKFLRFSGKVPVRTIHWSMHPEKNQEWYTRESKRRLSEEVAQEIDISYDKSTRGRVYEEFEHVPYGEFPYKPEWPLYVSWDYGLSDDTALIWWQRDPMSGRRRIVDAYWNSGKLIDFYIPFVTGQLPSGDTYKYSIDDLSVIEYHMGYKQAIHFGDPAGKQRSQAGGNRSVIDQLREFGIHVNTREDANKFEIRRTKAKLLMRDLDVNENPRTMYLRECMLNARYPARRDNSQAVTVAIKPVHDWTSHLRSAFEYYAVNERDYKLRRATDEKRFSHADKYATVIY